MSNQYRISASPHTFSERSTKGIMYQVAVSLVPVIAASCYFFRLRALMLIIVSCASCCAAEALFQTARKKPVTVSDGSAVVTGLLLALILPPTAPLWLVLVGGVVAVVFGKQIFGGLGHNIFNPALVGRAFLLIAFPTFMTSWVNPFKLDAVTTATPLGLMKFQHVVTPVHDLFLGTVSGSLGETSGLCILIGGLFLIALRALDWRIPAGYIGSVAVLGFVFHRVNPAVFPSVGFHLFSGGLMLGAVYMATDPVTSPIARGGRWIFGIGCGVVLVIIRLFGGMPEGVTFSILIMNAVTPLINRWIVPRRFGA